MSYQSLQFILFTGIVLVLYYCVHRKYQRYVLFAANLAFYAISGAKYLPFLAVTTIATYLTGRKMGKIYKAADAEIAACTDSAQKKELRNQSRNNAKKALKIGMAITIALLAVCKYTSFLLENVNSLLGALGVGTIPVFKVILPVGISFYSFMALSYVLDVYWKRYPAEEDFLRYATFLSYFPHVVQGPIDRFQEFKAQVKDGVSFSYQNLTFGAQLALWGFFKKLVIADRLGMFVDSVFESWASFNGLALIAAVVVYSVQIYADFSGCIDIVSGVSEMLGIKLRKNFNHPYFSRTMGEFWRRWHISLQEWFKDYIYFPVSSSGLIRKAKKHFKEKNQKRASELFTACFPILVVWLVTGIWHGAAWKYVAWGIFHAILLIGSKVFENQFARANQKLRIKTESFPWKLWQMARTFLLCCVGRIFFRADSIATAFAMIPKMLLPKATLQSLLHPGVSYGVTVNDIAVGAVAVLVLLVIDILQEKMPLRETLAKRNIVLRWVMIFGLLFAVLFFGVYGPGYGSGGFIYEQF